MKKVILAGLALSGVLVVYGQRPQVRQGLYVKNEHVTPKVAMEPLKPLEPVNPNLFKPSMSGLKESSNPNIVTILNLGTSANVLGYSGGTRTMVWANDDLNCVVNFHRMGPGITPPGLSGYLGMDIGLNMGKTQSDWTSQVQVYAATLAASPNYYDAGRYPSAAIYNPAGNTTLANAFLAYFAPNFANLIVGGFGGYSYGTANLADHADTTKHLRWYNPTPYTYIPEGFTIGNNGIAHMVNRDINAESGTEVYQDSVIYGRGVWNPVTKDFDYTFKTLAFPCNESKSAADCKVAVSPDGSVVWISVLTNFAGGSPGWQPLIDSTYYPLLRRSTDCGLTWESPIPVYLDGPNGISDIKNQYSDYFIMNFFVGPPWPTRDEIPYTCAFDHSLSVDKWGNPHIGVAVGYAPGGYSITSGVDSLINVYDIYSCDDGAHFFGNCMGPLKTFRGTWATNTCDNRVYISSNKAGDKMFFTWNDTRIDGELNNQYPDVWARGFDLITNKVTSDNGADAPNNVTFGSDIAQEAYWQCASPFVFTDNNKYTIPICTQWFSDADADVTFKYIPDFSYTAADFTIPIYPWPCWKSNANTSDLHGLEMLHDSPCPGVGIDQKSTEPDAVLVFPTPADDFVTVSLNLKKTSVVTTGIVNVFGQQVISVNNGTLGPGPQQFRMDVSNLPAGVYVITVSLGGDIFSRKMVVQ